MHILHSIHYCPVKSFPTNPTSVGIRNPRKPPSWTRCFFSRSEVFFFTIFLKHSLCLWNISFSSSLTGILPCNILWTQSQIQWTSSIPPSSTIRLHFCLSCLSLLIAFNSREKTCTLWAIIEEWRCMRSVQTLYSVKQPRYYTGSLLAYKLLPVNISTGSPSGQHMDLR